MSPQSGESLLHYRFVDKIGEGGMDVVWRAVDTSLDREVAIKILPDGSGLVYMQGNGASQDFWLLDLATMQSRRMTQLDSTATMRTFDITPDGKRIVFDRSSEDSDIELIELKPTG